MPTQHTTLKTSMVLSLIHKKREIMLSRDETMDSAGSGLGGAAKRGLSYD